MTKRFICFSSSTYASMASFVFSSVTRYFSLHATTSSIPFTESRGEDYSVTRTATSMGVVAAPKWWSSRGTRAKSW